MGRPEGADCGAQHPDDGQVLHQDQAGEDVQPARAIRVGGGGLPLGDGQLVTKPFRFHSIKLLF